jgi:hypothetical protein
MKINVLQKYAEHLRQRAQSAFMTKRLMAVFKGEATAADEDVDVSDIDIDNGNGEYSVEEVANLLTRTGRFDDYVEALDFLFNTQHGAALLRRLKARQQDKKGFSDAITAGRSEGLLEIGGRPRRLVPPDRQGRHHRHPRSRTDGHDNRRGETRRAGNVGGTGIL